MFKTKIRKCEAFRDGVKLLGTNDIFQKKLLSLKGSHYSTVYFPERYDLLDVNRKNISSIK